MFSVSGGPPCSASSAASKEMGTGAQNEPLGEPMQIRLNVKNTFIDAADDELDNDRFEEALRRMVSEPIPTRQYSGNAALNRHITVVKEAHGEEEDAEQETAHSSSTVPWGNSSAAMAMPSQECSIPSSSSASAAMAMPSQERSIKVKNTFIDVAEADDGFDAGLRGIRQARQQSEPVLQRQLSALSGSSHTVGIATGIAGMASAAVAEEAPNQAAFDAMLGAMHLRKEPPEEPETEIEPRTPAEEQQQWATYFTQPGAADMMNYIGAFPTDGLMFPQQGLGMVDPSQHEMRAAASERMDTPALPVEWTNTYTVMMRNLPNRYTQRMLLDEICDGGFMGTFDFLYLPIDPDTNANKGYGFINFLEPIHAWQFKCTYEGKQMSRFNSSKFVSVSPAALQGLEANYAHYSTSRCSRGDPAARPLFLREPQQTMNPRPAGGRPSRRGGRRRLQDVSLVDMAARAQKTPAPKSEAKGLPVGQIFGLGRACPPGPVPPGKTDKSPLVDGGGPAKFCPFCGGACKPEFRFCQFCGAGLDVIRDL